MEANSNKSLVSDGGLDSARQVSILLEERRAFESIYVNIAYGKAFTLLIAFAVLILDWIKIPQHNGSSWNFALAIIISGIGITMVYNRSNIEGKIKENLRLIEDLLREGGDSIIYRYIEEMVNIDTLPSFTLFLPKFSGSAKSEVAD